MTRTIVASAHREVIIGFDQPFCVIGERIQSDGRKEAFAAEDDGRQIFRQGRPAPPPPPRPPPPPPPTVIKDALEQVWAAAATMLDVMQA